MTENEIKIIEQKTGQNWLSMTEASRRCSYSQEYLSLLARRGKIFAQKIGRNWYTTEDALNDYLKKQSLTITVPRNVLGKLTASTSLTPEEPEGGEKPEEDHGGHSKIFEEFERLNPQMFQAPQKKGMFSQEAATTPPPKAESEQLSIDTEHGEVLEKLDRLSDSLENFAERVTRKISEPVQALTGEQEDFINIESQSPGFRFKQFDRYARSLMSTPTTMMMIMVTAVVAIFLFVGGFSFGQADYVVQQIKNAFKDADTLQGHFPGTHANEVLILDKAGNVSIFGHVETEGQLRSRAPNGVAPIVVDSMTLVENLNADYWDGMDQKDLTLAFVTKNGNLTTEDVFLEGNVEVGKTLTVKGAFKLMDSLDVFGRLGVFGEAVFSSDVTLTGGNLTLKNGNVDIQKGTITVASTNLVKNLNAEFLDGLRKGDINLDFVLSSGSTTSKALTVGGLTSTGTINSTGPGFFNSSVWSPAGSFGTVGAKTASFGSTTDPGGSGFEVHTGTFNLDKNGNLNLSGNLTVGNTATLANLIVNDFVKSDLISSGSFDLGSATNKWTNIYGINGFFDNIVFSGSLDFAGTTSASLSINTDNATADTEDSYLSFERGTTTPNATLKWNSTENRFEFNEPLFIASSSLTTFSVSGGPASISNTLYVQSAGNVGIGTTNPTNKLHLFQSGTLGILVDADSQGQAYFTAIGSGSGTTFSDSSQAAGIIELRDESGTANFFNVIYGQDNGGSNLSGVAFVNVDPSTNNGALAFLTRPTSGTLTERVRVTGAGNVGIGTTTPGGLLEVFGTSGFPSLDVTGSGVGSQVQIQRTAGFEGNLWFNTGTSGRWKIGVTATAESGSNAGSDFQIQNKDDAGANLGTALFIRRSSGNVGIGTTNPTTKFDVIGNASVSGDFEIGGNITSGTSISGNFDPTADDTYDLGDNSFRWRDLYLGPGSMHIGTSTADEYVLSYDTTSNYLGFNANGSGDPEVTFLSNGNVGVGTTNPVTKFHVFSGEVNIGTTSTGNTLNVGGDVRLWNDNATVLYGNSAAVLMTGHTTGNFWGVGAADGAVRNGLFFENGNSMRPSLRSYTDIDFFTNDDQTTVKMVIKGSGNIGIGTTNPTTKLDVIGAASISGHFEIGDATDGSDYVVINSQVKSNIVPFNNSEQFGSATNRWLRGYFDTVDALAFTAASTSISGTNAEAFTINADNATADAENSQIVFERGTPSINAQIQWDATNKRLNFNFPVFLQTADAPEPANNFTKLTLKGAVDQSTNDYFSIITSQSADLFKVTSTGNVGIGTTTPGQKLDLFDSGSSKHLTFNPGGTAIEASGGTLHINSTTNTEIGSNSLFVQNAGNVGIGTTNPAQKLHVVGTAILTADTASDITNKVSKFGSQARTNSQNPFYTLLSTAEAGDNTVFLGGGASDGQAATILKFYTAAAVNTATGTERMRIDNTGNVGIGTTGPTAKLEIKHSNTTEKHLQAVFGGANYAAIDLSYDTSTEVMRLYGGSGRISFNYNNGNGVRALMLNSTTAQLEIVQNNTTDTGADSLAPLYLSEARGGNGSGVDAVGSAITVAGGRGTGTGAGGAVIFQTAAAGGVSGSSLNALSERMRIDSTGNVGIGTTDPASRLHLEGAGGAVLTIERSDSTQGNGRINFLGNDGSLDGSIAYNDTIGGAITFHTAGSTRATITSDGNVGIGTTTVGARLVVESATGGAPLVVKTNANNVADFQSGNASSLVYFTPTGGDQWRLGAGDVNVNDFGIHNNTRATTAITITGGAAGGNIGIGTTAPTALTHIVGDTTTLFNVASGANSRFQVSEIGNIIVPTVGASIDVGGTTAVLETTDSPYNATLKAWNNLNLNSNYGGANTGHVLINGSGQGNVGIGTTTPTTRLDIIGNASVSLDFEIGGNITSGTSISGNFDPTADDTYDLGDNSFRWRDLYLGPSSIHIGNSTSDEFVLSYDTVANALNFNANGSGDPEFIIGSTGNINAGGSAASGRAIFNVQQSTTTTSGTIQDGLLLGNFVVGSDATSQIDGVYVGITTPNSVFTTTNVYGLNMGGVSKGASHTIENYAGIAIAAAPTATNKTNLLIGTSTIPAGTFELYSAGTGNSYLAGNVGIGTTAASRRLVIAASGGVATPGANIAGIEVRNTSSGLGANADLLFSASVGGTTHDYAAVSGVVTGQGAGTIGAITFATKSTVGATSLTERMRITSDGNVGIGTTNVDAKLEVVGTASISQNVYLSTQSGNVAIGTTDPGSTANFGKFIRILSSSGGSGLRLEDPGSGGTAGEIGYTDALGIILETMTQRNIIIKPGGTANVGIGTTSPAGKVDIVGDLSGSTNPLFRVASSSELFRIQENGNVGIGGVTDPGSKLVVQGTGNTSSTVAFNVRNSDQTGLFRVLDDGNVGIGTISPASKLDIVGTAGSASIFNIASASGTTVFNVSSTAGGPTIMSIDGPATANNQLRIKQDGTARAFMFYDNGNSVLTINRTGNTAGGINIDGSDNVGIGTTAPGSQLQLHGATDGEALKISRGTGSVRFTKGNNNDQFFLFNSDATVNMMTWIGASGNVGIGSTAPTATLDIVGNPGTATSPIFRVASVSELFRIQENGNVGIGTTGPNEDLDIRDSNGDTSAVINLAAAGQNGFFNTTESLFINFDTNNNSTEVLTIGANRSRTTGGVDIMTLLESGNVGIGTTAPGGKLQIRSGTVTSAGTDDSESLTITHTVSTVPSAIDSIFGGIVIQRDKATALAAGDALGGINFGGGPNAGDVRNGYAAIGALHGGSLGTGELVFYTANSDRTPSERVRISTSGLVGIGTTNPATKLQIYGSGNQELRIQTTDASSSILRFFTNGVERGMIYASTAANQLNIETGGSLRGTLDGSGFFTLSATNAFINSSVGVVANAADLCYNSSTGQFGACTSDERLKTNISTITSSGLDIVKQLRPVNYAWKDDPSNMQVGFIAQDVMGVIPSAVYETDNEYLGFKHEQVLPFAIKAIQELDARTASLSFRVDELEARMASSSGETVTVQSSGSGTTQVVSGTVDVLGTLAEAAITQVKTLWAKGDVIAEGIKKTYFAITNFNFGADKLASWTSRSIEISPDAPSAVAALFTGNGAQAADNSRVDLKENGTYLATYGVDSTRGEIQLSGSSELVNGEAKIFFDFSFSSIISPDVPLKVLLTPTTNTITGQLVVMEKTPYGFTAKELNGASNGKFDWLVIARRAGYEDVGIEPNSTAQGGEPLTEAPAEETASSSEETVSEPEPTPEPSATAEPEPSPEPSPSESPTPEPSPEPTPESTPEPSPES